MFNKIRIYIIQQKYATNCIPKIKMIAKIHMFNIYSNMSKWSFI